MADRDLEQPRQAGNQGGQVVEVEVVARVEAQTLRLRRLAGGHEAPQLLCFGRGAEGRGIGFGVEFDSICTDIFGESNLFFHGIHK